jgi:glycosyltransferase involved in cell wall biosynthesis
VRITFLLSQGLEDASSLGRHFPLAKELARLGHRVRVMAPHADWAGLRERHFWREGVEVWYVGQMHVHKHGSRKTYFSQPKLLWVASTTMLNMLALAASQPVDAIQLCKAQPINGLAALGVRLLRRRPLFLDSDDYETEFGRYSSAWQKRVVSHFERILPRRARAVTTHTQFNVERQIAYGVPPQKVLYVPNGIERSRFAGIREQDVQRLRAHLQIEGEKVVGYVGNLSLANHPVDLLLEAFARVHARDRGVRLLLVGGGEDYDLLSAMADDMGLADSVDFVGRVPPSQVPLYFRAADVSVEPVREDAVARARSPLKVVESLAAGTPVVAGDVGDRRDTLGEAGVAVAPGDPEALAEGLMHVLGDGSARERMAHAAEGVCEQYYWDVLVHRFEQVYSL